MTEPILFATVFLSLALVTDWIEAGATGWPRGAGLALAAACMTRYEGWLIAAAAILLAAIVLIRRGAPPVDGLRRAMRLAVVPLMAILLFLANSRWTTGFWFIPRDFFVPENAALDQPRLAWEQVRESVYQLSGTALVWPAYVAAALVAIAFIRSRRRASLVMVFAMFAAAALPWYAYVHGHPLRVRYGLPLVAACAALNGAGIGVLWRPLRGLAAIGVIAAGLFQTSPLDRQALLIVESQRDAPNAVGRQLVTEYLLQHYKGDGPIMMSMGSLAHYMHDLGRAGFGIRTFLHEGNGEAWRYAVLGPKGYVNWVVIEERAEGGDALYQAWKRNPRYLEGFERVAEGGGVALYRATRNSRASSESQMYGQARRPAAEIDFVAEESVGVDVSLCLLISELATDHPDVGHGRANAAEDDRTGRISARDVAC
jgi:hypothetical protein